jgi:hypothetical protein
MDGKTRMRDAFQPRSRGILSGLADSTRKPARVDREHVAVSGDDGMTQREMGSKCCPGTANSGERDVCASWVVVWRVIFSDRRIAECTTRRAML